MPDLRLLRMLCGAAWRTSRRDVLLVVTCDPLARVTGPITVLGVGMAAGGAAAADRAAITTGLALVLATMLVDHVLGRAAITARVRLEEATAAELDRRLLDAVARTATIDDLASRETAERIERLCSRERVDLTGSAFGALVLTAGAVAQFAVTAALLGAVHPVLLLLPLAAAPALWLGRYAVREEERALDGSRQPLAAGDALAAILATPAGGYAARTGGGLGYLAARCRELWAQSYRVRMAGEWRATVWNALGAVVTAAAVVAALTWTARAAARGDLPMTELAVVIALLGQLGGSLGWLVAQAARARRLLRVARDLDEVLRTAAPADDPAAGGGDRGACGATGDALVLDAVGYRYPEQSRPAVDGVSLTVPPGSIVALVGENGAGKSTLVGLITGLLRAAAGELRRGGQRLTDDIRARWERGVVAVVQDYGHYEFTAAESLALRDRTGEGAGEPELAAAARRGGFASVLRRLPAGWRTQLGTGWTGGVDLSGGEWQKIAVSRGFLDRPHWLFVMDEPTAALDAQSEAELFDTFRRETAAARAAGAIALYVTHRLAGTLDADLVVVMADGRIVDAGGPDELLGRCGAYRDLMDVQRAGYAL